MPPVFIAHLWVHSIHALHVLVWTGRYYITELLFKQYQQLQPYRELFWLNRIIAPAPTRFFTGTVANQNKDEYEEGILWEDVHECIAC